MAARATKLLELEVILEYLDNAAVANTSQAAVNGNLII
jgi:hypothetical protein